MVSLFLGDGFGRGLDFVQSVAGVQLGRPTERGRLFIKGIAKAHVYGAARGADCRQGHSQVMEPEKIQERLRTGHRPI